MSLGGRALYGWGKPTEGQRWTYRGRADRTRSSGVVPGRLRGREPRGPRVSRQPPTLGVVEGGGCGV